MKVTFNIDEELEARARKFAERRGITLEQMISDYIHELAYDVSNMPLEEVIRKLERMWATSGGHSGGETWTREEAHERGRVP